MKMEPLIPDPNGRWGYIRKGTPRQWNPSPIAKHKEFAQKISSANLMAKPLLCLKWLLGWWMTFLPLYPFLFLLDTSDPFNKALIFTIVLLPTAVLFAPVIVNLGAGTAGAASVLPEIVLFSKTEDALRRDADVFIPCRSKKL